MTSPDANTEVSWTARARARAGTDLGRRIFFKQGPPTSLGFSDEIFTNVIGNLIDRVTADRAAVFLLACDDGWMTSAFDDPDSVLLNPNSVRRNADALEIAGGQLASAVFALARQGGFNA